MEESIAAARSELAKMTPAGENEKEALKKATASLDEGAKVLATRQKHIQLADRSEYGWATVKYYEDDPLAANSDDEKCIKKAEKEAQREVEKKANAKKRKTSTTNAYRRPRVSPYQSEPSGPSPRRDVGQAPAMPSYQGRPRMLGPCFRCGAFGHLVATCTAKEKPYPFCQPVVSSAEPALGLLESNTTVVKVADLSAEYQKGVDGLMISDLAMCKGQPMASEVSGVDGSGSGELGSVSSEATLVNTGDITKFWEVESNEAVQITDVQGRLRLKLAFWQDVLQAPPPILDCIENGYRLPLKFIPPPHCQSNHKSTVVHHSFVADAVENLVKNRCALRVSGRPHVCSPLSVVSNSAGKLRLVLNLRYLNQYLHVLTFKYEDLRVAALLFDVDEYLFKFDLKSGYQHVDIHPDYHTYLGFQWETKGVTGFYVFTVLPFGLATACYLFTKMMRPLIKYWRGRGLKAIAYIDDGVVAVRGRQEALVESNRVKQDIENAGFVINVEKSIWDPSHAIEWLGFLIDLSVGEFSVPASKIDALKSKLLKTKEAKCVPARELASVIGKIISMSLALGPVTRLMTRNLYAVLNCRLAWCHRLTLSGEAHQEIDFWLSEITNFNGRHIWPKPSAVRVAYSDASDMGYGGYMVEHGNLVANGQWSTDEARQSSTWRELRAVKMVLESFQSKLKHERVRWFTDNQNVVRIVQYGSTKPSLQAEALGIFSLCVQGNIRLEPEWIPREQNELADYYSRVVDCDDWMLNPTIFAWLDTIWGPHSIDRFANAKNAQLQRFNSRFWFPGSEAVDAFTCTWVGENNWWCPPVHLVPRVVRHAQNTKASGTLIIPQWLSSPFWPLLFPDGLTPADFVVGVIVLPNSDTLFLPGQSGANLFKGLPNTPVLALRLVF